MPDPKLLDKLFASLDETQFEREYWPDRPCWCDGKTDRLPDALQDPLLSSIDALTAKYRGRISFGNAKTGSRTVAVDHVSAEMLKRMGLSLYLPEIEQTVPSLSALLREVESTLGAPPGSARIGAFIAPEDNGVTCHFDAEEVISIQLIGHKRFYISREKALEQPLGMQFNPGDVTFDDLYPQVGSGFPDPDKATFDCVDMKPGSVLFMPRGTWHHTQTESLSLSVSIIIRPPSALECVLDALRSRMLQSLKWRRPLHGAWGSSVVRNGAEQQLDELLNDLPGLATGLSLEDIRQTQLSETDRFSSINPESRFQSKPEAVLKLKLSGNAMEAAVLAKDESGRELETMRLEIPLPMIAAFEWLKRTSHSFSAREMAQEHRGLPMDQLLRILQALVRGGYLKQLWFRPVIEQKV
ncbi:MAG: cupin domain-containing protein [Candidatus Thiodiazotropha sp. (ex Notomyrtea botanica)]|nr:cupin domain-containing protein [Candidatus Thiodiazotropha sp. (ex Notomyrtea botanica)]